LDQVKSFSQFFDDLRDLEEPARLLRRTNRNFRHRRESRVARARDLWQRFVHGLSGLARHKTLSWVGLGALVLVVRAALLRVWPISRPSIYDEFSYILQADTFAHGRLANPAHALWRFFESTYILQQPTYASRFPPAQGLVMAIGQVIFGHPWFGV
jgi:hypothetical protein